MNKKQKTSIILTSLASIAVAGSLIAGGTYALFTSESETNIAVKSGTVNVVATLESLSSSHKAADANGEYQTVEGSLFNGTATIDEANQTLTIDKMVPMDKVTLNIKLENKSNVTAKYRTILQCVDDNGLFFGLNITLDGRVFDGFTAISKYAELAPGSDDIFIPVEIELPYEAGNEYQDKTCTISYHVEAIQANAAVEDIDENTLYIYNEFDHKALARKLATGAIPDNITNVLCKNIVSSEDSASSHLVSQTVITGESTLNLSGKTISVDQSNTSTYGNATPVLFTVSGENSSLTIDDSDNSGTITCEAGQDQVYGISIEDGATVTINGGNFYGAMSMVQVTQGNLIINGGFFDCAPTYKAYYKPYIPKFLINCIDRYYDDGTATVSIKGGTFVNFNPAVAPEKGTPTPSYVAEGYKVISETHDGDVWYTVVEDTGE